MPRLTQALCSLYACLRGLLLVCCSLASTVVCAQSHDDYPAKTIKMVVLFGPGGTSDLAARFFAQKLEPLLGQQVIVENRAGAGGTIGTMLVKNAPADGYTILVATNTPMSVNPITVKDLPYDPTNDFKAIAGLVRVQNVLLVSNESKLKTLADLVSAAKSSSPSLTVGTFSIGHQITTAWFSELAKIKFVNVPYKSGGDILTNLIGDQIDVGSMDVSAATGMLKSGKVRALATTGDTRHALFSDVPTVAESYPEYSTYSWSSLYVRSATPKNVTDRLSQAMAQALALPEARHFAMQAGGELMPLNSEQMTAMQQSELARFAAIAKTAGLAVR